MRTKLRFVRRLTGVKLANLFLDEENGKFYTTVDSHDWVNESSSILSYADISGDCWGYIHRKPQGDHQDLLESSGFECNDTFTREASNGPTRETTQTETNSAGQSNFSAPTV